MSGPVRWTIEFVQHDHEYTLDVYECVGTTRKPQLFLFVDAGEPVDSRFVPCWRVTVALIVVVVTKIAFSVCVDDGSDIGLAATGCEHTRTVGLIDFARVPQSEKGKVLIAS